MCNRVEEQLKPCIGVINVHVHVHVVVHANACTCTLHGMFT